MPPKPLILGFDTSDAHCCTALLADGECVAAIYEDMTRGQVERLMPMIAETLTEGGAEFRDLDAIGVGVGPGNFTGIRLSVSAARGLAMSLSIPAVGVSILEALALHTPGPVLSCIDARRGRVYAQGFRTAAPFDAALTDIAEIPQALSQQGLRCIGTGAAPVADHLNAQVAPSHFAPAAAIARIAAERWQDAPAAPAPLYMRAADAAPASDPPPEIIP
ncbi:hypothetical protein ACMU_14945 [Actibacterium mucosum KCTC 23349]|uniref:Gcp-like domain-containing protein n=1 Tax=Actibacterium mucosum KCTC 23349 TaxID=1454373 RepID=A0A037ZJP9_9RHOB|nr:tRNA (adenosine(37)-N6)-threonylcarbamoyltransferase complex dimerization subunit type 1 TsaB [Actibacterium mucosum]KAJ55051.1 hypothetical protein ACMU_14945 [Actibacterium mucosum KCTC 23349]